MNIQKRNDEILKELDNVKQEQGEIEKKCSKLCELKDNVLYKYLNFILIIIYGHGYS